MPCSMPMKNFCPTDSRARLYNALPLLHRSRRFARRGSMHIIYRGECLSIMRPSGSGKSTPYEEKSMPEFKYEPSMWVPFRDKAVIERVRNIKREDIEKHPNPNYKIKVYKDWMFPHVWVSNMFWHIKHSADSGEKVVFILPNPCPLYQCVAHLINKFQVDCRHVHGFAMDEYADQDGNIAPEDWPFGFTHAMKKFFLASIDEKLRPPENQIVGFTNKNIKDYDRMIEDLGGADAVFSGPGWTGHLAFIDPDAPEFKAENIEEWKQMGSRIVTLSPFTLAQNSMHGSFGKSGDLSAVPPKAATIGPRQIVEAKKRYQSFSISVHGTTTAWQRFIARLCMHGPVTPLVPESINQELGAEASISETVAMNIEPDWDKGY